MGKRESVKSLGFQNWQRCKNWWRWQQKEVQCTRYFDNQPCLLWNDPECFYSNKSQVTGLIFNIPVSPGGKNASREITVTLRNTLNLGFCLFVYFVKNQSYFPESGLWSLSLHKVLLHSKASGTSTLELSEHLKGIQISWSFIITDHLKSTDMTVIHFQDKPPLFPTWRTNLHKVSGTGLEPCAH